MQTYLEFEKPIAELETRVAELRETATASDIDIEAEVAKLEAKSTKLLKETYSRLTPWQKTQVARHPDRPHFKDFVDAIAEDFTPLAGDRAFADDPAIIGGLAKIDGRRVMSGAATTCLSSMAPASWTSCWRPDGKDRTLPSP